MTAPKFTASDLAHLRQFEHAAPAPVSTEPSPSIAKAVRRIVNTSDVPGYSRQQEDLDHAPAPYVRSDERECAACERVMPVEKTKPDFRNGRDLCRNTQECELALAKKRAKR